jgi:hypothetical protein
LNDHFEPEAEADDEDIEAMEEEEDGDGDGEDASSRHAIPATPPGLKKSIESLDGLLAEADEEEKIKAAMGIRLALGMAQELKNGKPLGSETTDLVAEWVKVYGQDVVDTAVKVAREFLIKPDEMRRVLGQRLGMGTPE